MRKVNKFQRSRNTFLFFSMFKLDLFVRIPYYVALFYSNLNGALETIVNNREFEIQGVLNQILSSLFRKKNSKLYPCVCIL